VSLPLTDVAGVDVRRVDVARTAVVVGMAATTAPLALAAASAVGDWGM
jgi:hypothetical protein